LDLSILHLFIDYNNYNGVLKFSITRHFHNLCIKMKLYRINMQSDQTVEAFRNNLESDPCNPRIVEVIPTESILTERFHLVESEGVVDSILALPDSNQPSFQINIGPNLTCVLKRQQVKRIYNFFNSFVTNFSLLDSIYKIYINIIEERKGTVPTQVIADVPQEKLVLEQPSLIKENKEELAPKNETETEIEYILNNFCINNQYRSFVIHHIFNHIRYFSNSIKITEDNVDLPVLFDNYYYGLNYDYIVTILKETFSVTDSNIISFNQKKILEMIVSTLEKQQDTDTKLILMLLFFIFYCYQVRVILTKYPNFDFSEFFTVETQQSGLNFFIKQFNMQKKMEIRIFEKEDDIDNELIDEISLKYKHLIPVSESDFLEIAIKDYKNPVDFKIKNFTVSEKRILDIDMLIKNDDAIKKVLENKKETVNTNVYNSRSCSSSLLNYEQKIITKTYHFFQEYTNDPTTLSSLLLVKDLPIPKAIINLFDFFSRNIQKLFFDKDNNSTLSYYKILMDNLPAPTSYSHQTYLYLIYNLIIPFYYETHNITKFEDVFL
jgi:hypothetical protein